MSLRQLAQHITKARIIGAHALKTLWRHLKETKMVIYSITSKLNSTFRTIDKATADKITAKVVGKLKLSL